MKLHCGKEYIYPKSAKKHIKNCEACSENWYWSEDWEKNMRRLKRKALFTNLFRRMLGVK